MITADSRSCPLTPAMIALMQLYVRAGTSDTATLARASGLSPETVETHFRNINRILGTYKRDQALLRTLKEGWITLN